MEKRSKVVLLPCKAYEEEELKRQLKRGLELLGGLSSIVKKNETILLKPNLLKKSETEESRHNASCGYGGFCPFIKGGGLSADKSRGFLRDEYCQEGDGALWDGPDFK